MINRTFKGRKYKRTYIGGSQKKETQIFLDVQDADNDFKNCNWFEYRRIIITLFDDILHVFLSWEILLKNLSIVFLLFSLLFYKSIFILLTFFGISLLIHISHLILIKFRKKKAADYNYVLSSVLNEIKQRSGLNLDK